MAESDQRTARQRPRRGLRMFEVVIFAIVVGVGAYAAGVRNGIQIGARREQASTSLPSGHPSTGDSSMPSVGETGMPPMDMDTLREKLEEFGRAELLDIGNQHLDQARAASGSEDAEAAPMRFMIAVAAYERALELEPGDPNVITDLGIAFRGLGDSEAAVARFREAAEADPKHAQSRFNLGLVLLYDLQKTEEAIEAWEDYLKIAPKADQGRKQVEEELAKLRG